MLGQILNILGIILLLHAGYSANHFKTLATVMNLQDKVSMPPIDVSWSSALKQPFYYIFSLIFLLFKM